MSPSPRTEAPPPRRLIPLLSVIPGLAQWWLGRPTRGLVFFLVATGAANVALLEWLLPASESSRLKFLLMATVALGTVFVAIADAYWFAWWLRRPKVRERRAELLRSSAQHLRAKRSGRARGAVLEVLRMDAHDARAHGWLACIERRAGRFEEALRHARIALRRSRGSADRARSRRELRRVEEALRGR